MADYYPLIARAVAGLEKNTGDARRALYERARTALVAQLRSVTPALSENDVTRERLALEELIRKVEAEAARKAWVDPAKRGHDDARSRARIPALGKSRADRSKTIRHRRHAPARTDGALLRQTASRMPRAAAPPAPHRRRPNGASAGMLGEQRYVDPVFDQPLSAENGSAAQPRVTNLRQRPSPTPSAVRCSTAA